MIASALWFYPRGELWVGTVAITVFALTDSVDGVMARILRERGTRRSTTWGAFLDSTCDRFGDAAVFGGLVVWFTGRGDERATALLALLCLVLGSVVPYVRARAEGLGMTASGGIAERADRLAVVLVATFAVGVGRPHCRPHRRPRPPGRGQRRDRVGQRAHTVRQQCAVPASPEGVDP